MKIQTGAGNFGEDRTMEGEEAALHTLLVGKRRDPEMQGALAEALGRTLNGMDWKIDGMASNLDDFKHGEREPARPQRDGGAAAR